MSPCFAPSQLESIFLVYRLLFLGFALPVALARLLFLRNTAAHFAGLDSLDVTTTGGRLRSYQWGTHGRMMFSSKEMNSFFYIDENII